MLNIGSPDGLFHDGDPAVGELGTIVTAAWLNAVQSEIVSVITGAGIAVDPAKSDQLLSAVRKMLTGVGKAAAVVVPEVIDLNAMTTTGFYSFAVASSNRPATGGGVLMVQAYSQNFVMQTAADDSGSGQTPRIFVRWLSSGVWKAWAELTKVADADARYLPKANPVVSGNVSFSGNNRIRDIGSGGLALDGALYSFLTSPSDAHLCQNAYWDGTSWLRYDTAKPAVALVGQNGKAYVLSAPAGANPIAWTGYYEVWSGANSGFVSGANGYQKLPSGLIIQWGYVAESQTLTDYRLFPISFPNACWGMVQSLEYASNGGFAGNWGSVFQVVDKTKFLWSAGGSLSAGGYCFYIALGN